MRLSFPGIGWGRKEVLIIYYDQEIIVPGNAVDGKPTVCSGTLHIYRTRQQHAHRKSWRQVK